VAKGHGAGDALLKRVVGAPRAGLRSHEPIIRHGGDEFLCALSDTTIENARRRFDHIASELTASPDGGSITVGFADSPP
jgi:GGDEF domain-containing protein